MGQHVKADKTEATKSMSDTVVLFTSRDTQTDQCTTGVHRRCWLQQKINVSGLLGACRPSHRNSSKFLIYFIFLEQKNESELRDKGKIEMSKRNFEEHSLRIIILIVCGSRHVAPWRPPCVSGFQCLTHLPCLSVLLLQVFLFFSLFSKSKTIV